MDLLKLGRGALDIYLGGCSFEVYFRGSGFFEVFLHLVVFHVLVLGEMVGLIVVGIIINHGVFVLAGFNKGYLLCHHRGRFSLLLLGTGLLNSSGDGGDWLLLG